MCGKYLKARQLAKEMEEKAEKTAEKKEEVKEKKEGAEKLLKITKDLDIDPGKAEEKIEEGKEEIEDKNFEKAGKNFEEVIEELHKIHSEKLDERLEPVKNFLKLSDEIEEGSKLRKEIEQAEDLLEEGKIKESFEKAEEIQKKSESMIDEEIEEQLKNVKSLLETVEKVGKEKGKAEKIVMKADYAYEGKEYDRAISLVRDARELIGDKLRGELDDMLSKFKKKMDRLDEKGIDISKSRELFKKANECKEEKDYGKTVRYAQMCRDRLDDHFVGLLRETVEELEDEIEEAKEIGAPVRTVEEMVEKIERGLDDRKVEEASSLLDQAFEKVKELKFEEVLNTIAESREYFIKAKEIGADISEPMQILSTARDSLKEGDYREALDLAKEGRQKVQNLVKEYDEVRQKINSKEEKVKRLKDELPIQLPKAEEIISEAEDKLQEEKYEESLEVLEDFDEEFDKKAYEKIMEVIEKFERLNKVGEDIGADMEELSRKLDEAVSKTKNSEYIEAAEIAKEGKKSSKDKIEAEIEDMRKNIREGIEEVEVLDEETKAEIEERLSKSRDKLDSENYIEAYNTLSESEEELKESQAENAERHIEEFSEFLTMLEEEVEPEKIDTTQYREDIEEVKDTLSKGEYKSALDRTDTLREELNEELKEETEQRFGRAKMEVIRAKKTGVDIDSFRKKLIECKKNMKEDNYIEAVQISHEMEKSVKEVRMERKEAYEKISDTASEVSRLKKEGKVDDISEIKEMLMKAKDEFREKDYSAAKKMAKEASGMIKKTEEISELKEKKEGILEKIDKIEGAEELSVETTDLKSDLEEAMELAEKNEASKAIEIVEETSDRLDKRLKENLEELITETESSMESAKKLGMDTEGVDLELSEAESLLGKERYWDCLEILREEKEKIQDLRDLHKKAEEDIKLVKEKIQQAQHISAGAGEGRKLLDDAKTAFEEDRYDESIKKAEEAEAEVEKALEKQVEKIINKFQEKIDSFRTKDVDTALADDLIQKAKRAKENGDYNEAINYSMQSEGELEKIELQQKVAKKSISKAKQKLESAKEKDIMIEQPKKSLQKSIKAYKSGFYVKAFDKAVNLGNELNDILECYERTESFLHNIEGIIDELEKEDVDDLIEVKEKINNRFQDGDYKSAYSYFGEVEKILEKNKMKDIIHRLQSEIESLPDEEKRVEAEKILERALSIVDIQSPIKAIKRINEVKELSGLKERKRYKETIDEVEDLVDKAKKFGASVVRVKNEIDEAKRLNEEGKVSKASEKAEEALDQVEEALQDYSPKIEIEALEELELDEWNETEILLKNDGNGVAQSPEIKMSGGDIEDFELKNKLKAGEEVKTSGRIKPTSEKATIVGKALRIFDKKQLEDKYELQLSDKDKKDDTGSKEEQEEDQGHVSIDI